MNQENNQNYTNIEGNLDAKDLKIGIILGRFNSFITQRLLEGALDCICRHGGSSQNVSVIWVPGSFEIPMILNQMLKSGKKYDGIICLGAVIRGATPHFDYIAAEVSKGIANLAYSCDTPVSFGVITTDTIEQAIERAGTKSGNKGFDAALSLIEMINLYKKDL